MISRDAAKRVLVRVVRERRLTGLPLAWFTGWSEKWLGPWTRGPAYTVAGVERMARDAADLALARYRPAEGRAA